MGIVGISSVELPTVGNTLIVGTAAAELTPRLPISVDPNGIPVRAPPPGVVGDVDVGVDDEAMLLDPEPHIPDIPEVSSIPEVVDIPDVADIPDDIDVAVEPDVAAVAGVAAPTAVPPPSKLALDPNIPDDEVPKVEHIVPLPGIAIVPVTPPVGAGLTPGDAISVAPIGIPVPPTDAPGLLPSGEVMPSEGVGVTAPTWANAGLAHNKGHAVATIKKGFMDVSPIRAEGLRGETIGRRHELRANRIFDSLLQNLVDLSHRGAVDAPADGCRDRRELVGPTGAPQGDIPFAAIEHPSHGEMDHSPAEAILREPVEFLDRGEVLRKSRREKFRIVLAQIVAGEAARFGHSAGQEAAAQRAIGQHRDVSRAAVGKNVLFDGAFEQVIGRLSGMQRRDLAKFLHLGRAEIANADRANFSGAMQFAHGVRDFRDRRVRIRPMDLV